MRRDALGDYNHQTTKRDLTARTARPSTHTVPMRSCQAVKAAAELVRQLGRVGLPLRRSSRTPLLAASSRAAPKSSPCVATRRHSRHSSCTRAWAAQQGDGREIRFERWRDKRLGYVQESCVQRGSGKGPDGGKGAAVRACEASGCVAGAGCARGAAEGVRRPRTGSSWSLACSQWP